MARTQGHTAGEISSLDIGESVRGLTQLKRISIVHEVGLNLEDTAEERDEWIGPSKLPTLVKVESRVVTRSSRALMSPTYVATIRRRKARVISEAVSTLVKDVHRDDFAVCTYPVLEMMRELLTALADGSREGNSREVLRQIRDSFLNGGWENYRKPGTRNAVDTTLRVLAESEEVLPRHVDESFDRLFDAGLTLVGAPLDDGEEEQEEVPH